MRGRKGIPSARIHEGNPLPAVELDLPDRFHFGTEINLRPSDLDRFGRLATQALVSLLDEARMKFFRSMGYRDGDVEGSWFVVVDAVLVHWAGCAAGDSLSFEMTAGNFIPTGCDLFYRVANIRTKAIVAKAKMGVEFLDSGVAKPIEVPQGFRSRFA